MRTSEQPSSTASWIVSAVIVVVVAGAAATFLVGGQASTDVDITMSRFQFDPAVIEVPAEQDLTLTFTNEDDVAHDISFGKELLVDERDRPVAFAADLLEGVAVDASPAEAVVRDPDEHTLVVVAPDATVTLRFILPSEKTGEWMMGCFHGGGCQFQAGLQGTLIVE